MEAHKNNIPVYKALKQCIHNYFEVTGKTHYANPEFWVKAICYLTIPLAGYLILLGWGSASLVIVAACYLLLNLGSTLFVVNVAHDASHQSLSKNRAINNLLSYSWNMMGISKRLWEFQHHRSHHNHTGNPVKDVDMAENFWIRYSPVHKYRSYYKYQHLYAPFLYLLFGIFVVFVKDFIMLFTGKLMPYGVTRLPRYFWVKLLWTKLLYSFLILIIPMWVLPFSWWMVLTLYLVSLSICTGLMLIVLVIPHVNEFTVLYKKDFLIKTQEDWFMHQLHSNVDSSSDSKWLNRLLGGLNTHFVHHLFPNICHIHYIQLTREIKETLNRRGIPYQERSFISAVTDHFKFLKQMGMKPAAYQERYTPLSVAN